MRGIRGINALALGSWLLLLSVVVGFILATDMRVAERAFRDEVAYLHRHASDRVHTNESVVEGFAAMVALMGPLDHDKARAYARRIRKRYPQITCFEIVERGRVGDTAVPAPRATDVEGDIIAFTYTFEDDYLEITVTGPDGEEMTGATVNFTSDTEFTWDAEDGTFVKQ